MKEQTKYFDEHVFESVISGGVDFYKVTSPLVKIIETSEENRVKTREMVGERVGENDTINLLSDNERTVFEKMQAQIKRNFAGLGYEI